MLSANPRSYQGLYRAPDGVTAEEVLSFATLGKSILQLHEGFHKLLYCCCCCLLSLYILEPPQCRPPLRNHVQVHCNHCVRYKTLEFITFLTSSSAGSCKWNLKLRIWLNHVSYSPTVWIYQHWNNLHNRFSKNLHLFLHFFEKPCLWAFSVSFLLFYWKRRGKKILQ